MIPKIIHYVWVGNNEKTDLIKKCISSWKKFLPDYEIREWNNSDLEKFDNNYVIQAYENKKYAFVSDYVRLFALYNYGGIYLDTDVEIKDNLDEFLIHDFFSGFELYNDKYFPITALMGAVPKNEIIQNLLDYYTNRNFVTKSGFDLTPNTQIISEFFEKKFNVTPLYDGTKIIKLNKNSIIYPYWYFCTEKLNQKSYAQHHFNGSWKDGYTRKILLNFGNYCISKIKYDSEAKQFKFPSYNNEIILLYIMLKNNKYLMLTENNK